MKNKYKNKSGSTEHEDFIISTQSLLTRFNKKLDFLFYLSIFIECYNTKYFARYLLLFKPEKLTELGDITDRKITVIKNILNIFIKKPEKIILENENDRQKINEALYFVVLYFNLHFQKEKVKDLFENEQICESLYKNLIKYENLFKGLILPKKDVVKLIKKLDNYKQVSNILSYIGKDTLKFLEVINEERVFIGILFQKEKNDIQINDKKEKSEIPVIDVENYVNPKKEDDIIYPIKFNN